MCAIDITNTNCGEIHTDNPYYLSRVTPIAIIGAGAAGVATASALLVAGYTNFVVYEKQSGIGGVWYHNYPGAAVQTSPHQYEFPGYPYPDEIRNRVHPPAPTLPEVRTYLNNFCKTTGIMEKIQFCTSVIDISRKNDNYWTIVTSVRKEDGTTVQETKSFSFVILCSGIFSNSPKQLKIPGMDEFVNEGQGRIVHTSQWTNVDEFRNQRVLIIGNGKSAADAAVVAAAVAKDMGSPPPIQAIRNQQWYAPRFLLRFKWIFHSRFVSSLLPRHGEETSIIAILLHSLFYPVKYILWRILEIAFLILLRLPYKVWPKFGTIENGSVSTTVLVSDNRHLQPIRNGEIDMRICEVKKLFKTKEAMLSTGDIVPVDVVVNGTGWDFDFSFLDEKSVLSHLDFANDGLWLYRNVLPVNLHGIAFVGSNVATFLNPYTFYVQAYWLVGLLSGKRSPMSKEIMAECVKRDKEFKRRIYPFTNKRGASIEAYVQHYHDLLFYDQGINPRVYRGFFGPLFNMILPILPETMSETFDKLKLSYGSKK